MGFRGSLLSLHGNNRPELMVKFVLEIRLWLRINDTEQSLDLKW